MGKLLEGVCIPSQRVAPSGLSGLKAGVSNLFQFFDENVINPWLNFYHPCLFTSEFVSSKGKIVKRYTHEDVKTPLACLEQLTEKGLVRFKTGITLEKLQALAHAQTDLVAAQAMQKDMAKLFAKFNAESKKKQWVG